ncbi:KOW motif-containing protein [Stratiformator vulcanicus]|uniref:Transcription antitermination protein NusG n=1 Tax=Stratiformator vulcanicus TaxID=2527980 RepID=A0A517QVZ8_9PLAN|nr:KOW motif-containing protein [Stratiformator vulcanicus]QDT35743.1 transcription antitermination protein NusG [Stratiformator vulcanicus]
MAGRERQPLRIGDKVRVIAGPFESFEGDLVGFNRETGHWTVTVLVFGQPTQLDLRPEALRHATALE